MSYLGIQFVGAVKRMKGNDLLESATVTATVLNFYVQFHMVNSKVSLYSSCSLAFPWQHHRLSALFCEYLMAKISQQPGAVAATAVDTSKLFFLFWWALHSRHLNVTLFNAVLLYVKLESSKQHVRRHVLGGNHTKSEGWGNPVLVSKPRGACVCHAVVKPKWFFAFMAGGVTLFHFSQC